VAQKTIQMESALDFTTFYFCVQILLKNFLS